MITEPMLASYLRRYWKLANVQISVHNGGMGSKTWIVHRGPGRWVAKAVADHAGSQFKGGLMIANWLDEAGIPAGAAVPAGDGQLTVRAGESWLALLTWVPGEPLSGKNAAEQNLIGSTLARVHLALAGRDPEDAARFHWVDPDASYLSLRPWLRPAIAGALGALEAVGPAGLTQGLLHADPAPDAFRFDGHRCGIIDWSYFLHGPLLYDLASAVMYAGGTEQARPLLGAYLSAGVLDRGEVEAGLEAMVRFRWAVQANYFAWRISENDLTGITGPEVNEKHLEDARLFLSSFSD
ncbi:MAG TPA: phosphotransferase [Streptosporangiaceae bacterium]|nr:phosphotransferase [Streptosporangiaceae bacterium]